jgi:tetratricopeptide (TPR) repeat protein
LARKGRNVRGGRKSIDASRTCIFRDLDVGRSVCFEVGQLRSRPVSTKLRRVTKHCFWVLACVLACSAGTAGRERGKPPGAATAPADPERNLARADRHFEGSRYDEAEALYRALLEAACCSRTAERRLAELLLLRGRAEEALAIATRTTRTGNTRVLARALRALDRSADAERVLETALADNALGDDERWPLLVLLGELLIDSGRRKAAEPRLMQLVEAYNDDRIRDDDGSAMLMVARAAELLRSPEDANEAYNLAEQALGHDEELLLARARLFLDNYDPGHAEEVVSEVLELAPNHPDALVVLAEVRLDQAMDFGAAKELAARALAVNPTHARAHFVLAGVALRDMQLERALELVATGLGRNPGQLELESLRAAAQFLADDSRGFEETRARVFAQNPEYSKFYGIVAEYAEWEHRYAKVVEMMEQAVAIDPEDAKAHAQLGFNRIRNGQERSGVEALRRAFAKDPFNVRVHNTLDLYEKIVPNEYRSETHGQFEFRFPNIEQPVLSREVPPLVDRAWDKMIEYYAFEPQTPVGIELYHDRAHFAVRTSGLPQIAIQGVCFGRTLASMTPRGEQFNLGMTLWHELAHVFHIQLSHSHVPRWFTEGLAEYETLVERPEWKRERDAELYTAFNAGRIPKIGAMNEAFTHAESLLDVTVAYYASTQIVSMLAEQFGRGKLREMLVAWGRGERHEQVFRGVLGVGSDELDRRFHAFLRQRLSRFQKQYQPPTAAASAEPPVASGKAETDAHAWARLAVRLLENGDTEGAKAAFARAEKAQAGHPDVLWVEATLALALEDAPRALSSAQRLVESGRDGYEVQALIARAADPDKQVAVFDAALVRAHEFDPERSEPLYTLLRRASAQKNASAELRWLTALGPLVEHDGAIQRRWAELLLEGGELSAALAAAQAAVYAAMEEPASYATLARVLERQQRFAQAEAAWQSAVRCPAAPAELAQAYAEASQFYQRRGKAAQARDAQKKAAELRASLEP